MGFRTPDLGYSEVFRGIKSSTFKYFGGGVHFWTTFGPPLDHFWTTLENSGSKDGVQIRPKQRQNEGFGVFRTSEWIHFGSRLRIWSGPEMVQNGSKMGHFGVLRSTTFPIKTLRFPITRAREGI